MTNISDYQLLDSVTDIVPNTMFFLKDTSERYVLSNDMHTFMCGAECSADIIGRTTCDFFAKNLTSRYANMDQKVLGGNNYQDRFDFLPDANGNLIWTLFNRTQVRSKKGEILIMGISRQLPCFRNSSKVYQRLHQATEFISENFKNDISAKELANRNNCSISQIERDFSSILNMTPTSYQARLKIRYIKSQLEAGVPLVYIAFDVGFSEQSTLSRYFKKNTNITMQEYKRTYFSNRSVCC